MLEEQKARTIADQLGHAQSPTHDLQITAEGVRPTANAFKNKTKNQNSFKNAKRTESEIYAELRKSHAPRLEEVEDQFLMQRVDAGKKDQVDVVIPDVVPQLQAQGKRLQNYRNYQQFNEVGLKNSYLSDASNRRAAQESQSLALNVSNARTLPASRQQNQRPSRRNISQIHNNYLLSPKNLNNNFRSPHQGIISEDLSGFKIQGKSALSRTKHYGAAAHHSNAKQGASLLIPNSGDGDDEAGAFN